MSSSPVGGVLRRGSQRVVFELSGRLDQLDTNAVSNALGQSVTARTGRFTNDIDLRIETGETIIDNDELFEMENKVQTALANTHDITGWRLEVS